MKAIHSLWTLPNIEREYSTHEDRAKGGWLSQKYHLMSWALSCLTIKRFFPRIELYTDLKGKELLVDKINLPYNKVEVVLDELNHYNPHLWVIGKTRVYGLQREAFLHFDGDVYLWESLNEKIINAPLIAQNPEAEPIYYKEILQKIKTHFKLPSFLEKALSSNKKVYAASAGIIGGQNSAFFRKFSELSFQFIDDNLHNLHLINIDRLNVVLDQYFYYILAEEMGIPISYYIKEPSIGNYENLIQFYGVPHFTKYVHVIGEQYKKSTQITEYVETRLRIEFPEYYYKIISLLENHLI